MLYSAFPNDAIKPSACNPEANPIDCLEIERHAVRWLTSSDQGNTWEDQGVLLSFPDGVWSSGALVMKDEIWVYYIDGTFPVSRSKIRRQRVNKQTIRPIAPRKRVRHPGNGLSNVDMRRHRRHIYLSGDRNRASEGFVYRSSGGLHFHSATCWPVPILSSAGIKLLGPNLATITPLQILTG